MKQFPLYALTLLLGVPLLAAPATKPATKAKPVAKPKPKPKATPRPVSKPEPTPEPIAEVGPKTWAVLVGVSHYQNSQIASLHYPAKDATSVRDALIDPKVGGIPAKQVLLLTDDSATRDKIMGAVSSFLEPNVKEGDKIIVFLAGHGVAKGAGLDAKSYLLPTDVKGLTTAALENSAVPLHTLTESLGKLPAAQFVIFSDACREDPTPGRGIKANDRSDVISRDSTVVPNNPNVPNAESATLFACSLGQRAFEDETYGHGVFTKWIVDGLKQGDVAEKPTGAVDMGRLRDFVTTHVNEWAKSTSASGNFEIEQTPDLEVAAEITKPIVVLDYKGRLSDTVAPASTPRLAIVAPEGAQVSINGARAGVGTVQKDVPTAGDYTISVTKVGFAPVSRSVKAISGYENQIVIPMQPTGGATPIAGTAPSTQATDFYNRALDAENRQQWEVAEQGFAATIGADPKFTAAYEASYDLHVLQNRNIDALADALGLFAASPRSAHSFAFLSEAYSRFATKGAGTSGAKMVPTVGNYGAPKDQNEAAKLAVKSAKEAVDLSASSAEAQLAQGYALAAQDLQGKRKNESLAAFGKAVFSDPTDAASQVGLGYGIRFYASLLKPKEQDQQKSELTRAIAALNEAVRLRPNYYEAHRELAFCYMMMENTEAALKECNLARANRGGAGDVNEIAGIEVAMGGLHKKIADSSTGDQKTANEEASKGYLDEAQDTSSSIDLKDALTILNLAGVSTSLSSFLPAKFLPLLDIRGAIRGKIDDTINQKIPGKVRNIPGFKMPKF